ncbi:MAG: peptidylprolyl isomerase [Candidatus Saccharimonadia bacterium]
MADETPEVKDNTDNKTKSEDQPEKKAEEVSKKAETTEKTLNMEKVETKTTESKKSSTSSTKKPKPQLSMPSKKAMTWIGSAIVAAIIVLLVVFGVLIYKFKSDSPLVYDVAKYVPYPVERVNGSFVSYGDYLFELKSVKQYYESQTTQSGQAGIDFNSADGKAKLAQLRIQIMAQLTQDTVTKQLISKNKINVTSKQVTDQVNQIVNASGGTAKVKSVLEQYYGWTINDLKGQVKFQLQKQALQTKLSSDNSLNAQAKAKANSILAQLSSGADFATLAKKYSQDSSASNGGDMGFFSKGQVGDTTFDNTAFGQTPGQVSGVIHTKFGYQIIKTIEFNSDNSQVHAAQILVEPIDFTQFITDQTTAAKVTKYFSV